MIKNYDRMLRLLKLGKLREKKRGFRKATIEKFFSQWNQKKNVI